MRVATDDACIGEIATTCVDHCNNRHYMMRPLWQVLVRCEYSKRRRGTIYLQFPSLAFRPKHSLLPPQPKCPTSRRCSVQRACQQNCMHHSRTPRLRTFSLLFHLLLSIPHGHTKRVLSNIVCFLYSQKSCNLQDIVAARTSCLQLASPQLMLSVKTTIPSNL